MKKSEWVPLAVLGVAWGAIGLVTIFSLIQDPSVAVDGPAVVDPENVDPRRTLLQTSDIREPGGLVGNIGSGLFSMIVLAFFSICLCLMAEANSESPGVLRCIVLTLYFALWG